MFSNQEYADMLLVYGEALHNSNLAAKIYRDRFRQRLHPDRRTFVLVYQRLRDTGSVQPTKKRTRERQVSVQQEEQDSGAETETKPEDETNRSLDHQSPDMAITIDDVVRFLGKYYTQESCKQLKDQVILLNKPRTEYSSLTTVTPKGVWLSIQEVYQSNSNVQIDTENKDRPDLLEVRPTSTCLNKRPADDSFLHSPVTKRINLENTSLLLPSSSSSSGITGTIKTEVDVEYDDVVQRTLLPSGVRIKKEEIPDTSEASSYILSSDVRIKEEDMSDDEVEEIDVIPPPHLMQVKKEELSSDEEVEEVNVIPPPGVPVQVKKREASSDEELGLDSVLENSSPSSSRSTLSAPESRDILLSMLMYEARKQHRPKPGTVIEQLRLRAEGRDLLVKPPMDPLVSDVEEFVSDDESDTPEGTAVNEEVERILHERTVDDFTEADMDDPVKAERYLQVAMETKDALDKEIESLEKEKKQLTDKYTSLKTELKQFLEDHHVSKEDYQAALLEVNRIQNSTTKTKSQPVPTSNI